MADLKKSIEICGSGDAFAYPYGDYNDSSVAMVKEAGFLCAVTTQPGKAKPGHNPLLLPRVRACPWDRAWRHSRRKYSHKEKEWLGWHN